MEMLEHTKELLEELGQDGAMAGEEREAEGGEDEESEEDSDIEQLEEDTAETDNNDMDQS